MRKGVNVVMLKEQCKASHAVSTQSIAQLSHAHALHTTKLSALHITLFPLEATFLVAVFHEEQLVQLLASKLAVGKGGRSQLHNQASKVANNNTHKSKQHVL